VTCPLSILPIPTGIPAWGYPAVSFEPCITKGSGCFPVSRTPRQPSFFSVGTASLTFAGSSRSRSEKKSGSSSASRRTAAFTTGSNVILIANEWKSLNPNVRALEDRAIILHFCPSNEEVHRKVGEWFDDREVYDLLCRLVPVVSALSMRHYCKGSQLRRAGIADWRSSLLQMMIPDRRIAGVIAVQNDPTFRSERERIARFTASTGASRATYFRIKSKLAMTP
jgi:hypothetical protein